MTAGESMVHLVKNSPYKKGKKVHGKISNPLWETTDELYSLYTNPLTIYYALN